jgi:hypothetical protein
MRKTAASLLAAAVLGGLGVAVALILTGDAARPPNFCLKHPNHPSCQTTTSTTTSTTTTTTTSPPGGYPYSYFTGPLGQNEWLPSKPGAFLIGFQGGPGVDWPTQQARILQREADMGRKWDGIHIHWGGGGTYAGQANCLPASRISEDGVQWIHDHGSLPFVSWSPDRTIGEVNSGAVDACFAAAADYFKTKPFAIMLRLWHEFDGDWFKWSCSPGAANGSVNYCGQPFIDAWRRVVGIFKARGATNVGFWWNPGERVNDIWRTRIDSSYPGDAYVDWVGAESYNWCYVDENCWTTPLHPGWGEFRELSFYDSLGYCCGRSIYSVYGPRKPFAPGEHGTVYDPNQPAKKGQWFRNELAAAKTMAYLVGLSYFDQDVSMETGTYDPKRQFMVDYPTSNPDVYAGFKALAADPWFNTR